MDIVQLLIRNWLAQIILKEMNVFGRIMKFVKKKLVKIPHQLLIPTSHVKIIFRKINVLQNKAGDVSKTLLAHQS